jgi:hypothetical protein
MIQKAKCHAVKMALTARDVLTDDSGEGALDIGIAILIAVVLGALLLAGLYALFGNTILPTITSKIKDMFNYNG